MSGAKSFVDPLTSLRADAPSPRSGYHSSFSLLYVVYSHRLSGRFQCEICADVVDASLHSAANSTFATKSGVLASDTRSSPPWMRPTLEVAEARRRFGEWDFLHARVTDSRNLDYVEEPNHALR